jgi:hypothetical protein
MTAHVTYQGGGLLLPTRTPYDRQLLQEHVLHLARREDTIQVRVKRTTWVVETLPEDHSVTCIRCREPLKLAALHTAGHVKMHCATCALS